MAATPRDMLLFAETVWPAMRRYLKMPRDGEKDVGVFLCHGIKVDHVPTSPLAQKRTPAHRRTYGCAVCRRSISLSERREDLEVLFAAERPDLAFLIVRREGIAQGWYDSNVPVSADDADRAAKYERGELLPPEPAD